jgi:hypothetical protein
VTSDANESASLGKALPPIRSAHGAGNTFVPFNLEPQRYKDKSLAEVVADLLKRLAEFTATRRDYYNQRRAVSTRWVFGSRAFLAGAGAIAFLLTAAAAAFQLNPDFMPWSGRALILALVIYALMGAIAFYDRATDKASAYFRYVIALLSIRDLWTKLEFEVLKELEKVRKATDIQTAEAAAREQILALSEAYCIDLDKITTTEATEWRTEFQTSMGELEETARKGGEDVLKRIEDYAKAAEKAAADAKAAVEAMRPGQVNLAVKGNFEGEVIVLVDGAEMARSTGKTIALDNVRVGARKMTVRATSGGRLLEASQIIDIKPGIQPLELQF